MTRRSNRRQLQKKDDPLEADDDTNVAEMVTEDVKEEEKYKNNDVVETMDQDEVGSVTSELDSIASGSTLTTRSRHRGGPGPNTTATKGKKGGARVSKTSVATANPVNSSSKGG